MDQLHNSKRGILYGVGVGPGDPELMTLKAVRCLDKCPVLAIPGKEKDTCVAYQIAVQSVPGIEDKQCLCLHMPMTKDKDILRECHRNACRQITDQLDLGYDVALITLGDSTVYATSLYLAEGVERAGYEVAMINGIPSFCAAAARLNHALVNGAEQLHIIPASYDIDKALQLDGVKVFMKSGSQYKAVKQKLIESGKKAVMAENCGMPGERIYQSLEEMPEEAGYFTLLIVRDGQEEV